MTKQRIRVLFFPVGKPAETIWIAPTPTAIAALVAGSPGGFWDRGRVGVRTHVYVDDQGVAKGLPPNVIAPTYGAAFHGPALLIAESPGPEGYGLAGLSDEEIAEGLLFARPLDGVPTPLFGARAKP